MKNVVFGVNHEVIGPDDKIVSAASCTTNAITRCSKVMQDKYGIRHGHVGRRSTPIPTIRTSSTTITKASARSAAQPSTW